MPSPVAHLAQHRADADRRGTQVERQHHDPAGPRARAAGGCWSRTSPPHRAACTRSPSGSSRVSARLRGSPRAADQRPSSGGRGWPPRTRSWRSALRLRRGGRRGGDVPARDRGAERLPLGGGARRRRRATTSTGRSTTTAPSSSSSRCAAPCSSSRATCCRRRGGAPRRGSPSSCSARLAKEVEAHGLADDGRRLARRAPATPSSTAWPRAAPATTAELRERSRRSARSPGLAPGKSYGGSFPIAPRVLGTLGATGQIVRGINDGRLAVLPPAVDPDRGLARRAPQPRRRAPTATASSSVAGCAGSGPAPRPTWSGGSARPRPPYAAPSPTSARSRSRSTPEAPAGCCPTTSTTCGAGEPWAALLPVLDPDDHGLEAARLLPRPRRRALPLRHQRQRRHHRLVGRPRRRLLGAGPATAWSCVVPRGDPGAEALAALEVEADRLTGLARRRRCRPSTRRCR